MRAVDEALRFSGGLFLAMRTAPTTSDRLLQRHLVLTTTEPRFEAQLRKLARV